MTRKIKESAILKTKNSEKALPVRLNNNKGSKPQNTVTAKLKKVWRGGSESIANVLKNLRSKLSAKSNKKQQIEIQKSPITTKQLPTRINKNSRIGKYWQLLLNFVKKFFNKIKQVGKFIGSKIQAIDSRFKKNKIYRVVSEKVSWVIIAIFKLFRDTWQESWFNKALLIMAIALILYPFYPEFTYRFDQIFRHDKFVAPEINSAQDADKIAIQIIIPTDTVNESSFQKSDNKIKDRVIISSIGVDQPIIFGNDESSLKKGTWMKPNSTPLGESGNKILIAHRFSFQGGGGPFYHLKKVNVGDEVVLYVNNVYYKYKVKEKMVVDQTEVWVENPSDQDILTLYTCEGLKAEKRVVVKATRD
ncbi:MAG: sortase [bacterium]